MILLRLVSLFSRRLLRFFNLVEDQFEATYANANIIGEDASKLIIDQIESGTPFVLTRFGYSELRTILTYLHVNEKENAIRKYWRFVLGERVEPWWHPNTFKIITFNAGVFPKRKGIIEEYCRLVLNEISEIDILASWLGGEKLIIPVISNSPRIRFKDLYHFRHSKPWTQALAGKKVLVVHPFSQSIQSQYKKKHLIFEGRYELPEFTLKTFKSVQTIAGNKSNDFETWFDALNYMKTEIGQIDFDIAILGCGAYGMPLGIHIKQIGKQALHLGGMTQYLFGIKGSRWENDPDFNHLINEHWVKPKIEETPIGHHNIDENCYW